MVPNQEDLGRPKCSIHGVYLNKTTGVCIKCYKSEWQKSKKLGTQPVKPERELCPVHKVPLGKYTNRCRKCYERDWALENSDKRAKYTRDMKERNRSGFNNNRLIRKYETRYGLTRNQAIEILEKRGEACEICGGNNQGKALHLDHCHGTNKVRGYLCQKCNMALGLLGDNIETLSNMIEYLRKFK